MASQTTDASAGANASSRDRTPGESSVLIDVHDVATLLRCSPRHIWRMADAGKMPRPYKLGALCRWDRAAIQRWIAEGCPSCRRG